MIETNSKKNIDWFVKFNSSSTHNNFTRNPVAYFCAEFALIDDMPTYAGGLGILAGDYILEAADRDFPIIGIGLYYKKGQNSNNPEGEQDATKFGLQLVIDKDTNNKLLIPVPIGEKDVYAQVWKWQSKNNCVYFLDTNVSENEELDSQITEHLYVENREIRLKQELLLGIGGVKLLRKLDILPSVYHLNEGHSAFLIMELLGEQLHKGLSFYEALNKIKENVVFTNHTLVLEGQEMFTFEALTHNTKKLCSDLNIDIQNIIQKGKSKTEDGLFSMTTFALNGSRITNAVSEIHGVKARELWNKFPIIHITNGIYIPRWDKIKSDNILKEHQKNEEELLGLIRKTRGDDWKKEALLIGWSRRFAPYKRPLALLEDIAKLKKIFEQNKGKVHVVYSAPLDESDAERNEILNKLSKLIETDFKDYVTFIPHYKIDIAKKLVAGCDIWLNTPIVGREACGTSGMKAALNGTLLASTDDGWIPEIPLNNFGWIIKDNDITSDLLNIIEGKIIPNYNELLEKGRESNWANNMTKSRNIVLDKFSTTRMLQDYIEKLYVITNYK